MNSSDEITGLDESVDRLWKDTEEDKKRLADRVEILKLLRKASREIQELKKSRVTREEMAEFFENFLNEFSHVIDDIEDTKTKGLFTGFMETMSKTVNAFKNG